ncbi:hypothetical protein [Zoogloea sp.]|uniref:hypothetical protein n=1 Tax=Zoogloea sp. TaxID=49181 RepID=UPI0025F20064|nr:hypothetical protein [Zoogloea sp.]MCK6396315.1 hypothetical protein [Zoogloea sp.]
MEIVIFWLVLDALFWLLRLRPNSLVSRTAFTWLGPKPMVGELWGRYQLRWSMYSLGWLLQFALAFSVLLFVVGKWKLVELDGFAGVVLFTLPFGIAMAAIAALGFAVKSAKAHWLGPNPIYAGDGEGSAV